MRLDSKTATDLAVWYLNEFAEGKMCNRTEFAEFQDWYEQKIEEDPGFQTNFYGAIAYYEVHPVLLVPVEPGKSHVSTPEPDPTPDVPPDTVDPGTGSAATNPQPPATTTPSPSQPQPTPIPSQPSGGSTPTGSSSKYPLIEEES